MFCALDDNLTDDYERYREHYASCRGSVPSRDQQLGVLATESGGKAIAVVAVKQVDDNVWRHAVHESLGFVPFSEHFV